MYPKKENSLEVIYRKTSDRSPRLLSVQVNQTPGLYAGPGVYSGSGPGFYPKFYGIYNPRGVHPLVSARPPDRKSVV